MRTNLTQPKGRRAQSGASQLFLGMSIFLWVSASLIASFPKGAVVIFAVSAWLLAVLSLVLWALSCVRQRLS